MQSILPEHPECILDINYKKWPTACKTRRHPLPVRLESKEARSPSDPLDDR